MELDLFSFPDEIGSGLAVFHPKGGIVRNELESYSRAKHIEAGYQFVNSPHITKAQLFHTSGHLDWYADGMFPPMHIDAEFNEDGTLRKPGQDYYLKPMNCPMHCLIFRARGRSYRELPLRLFEFGTVYRYEKSGVVHGLTRVRGFTMDDAHIFCTRDQMRDELASLLRFVLDLLGDYGLERLLPGAVHQGPGQVRRLRRGLGGGHQHPGRGRRGVRAGAGARPGRRGVLRAEDLRAGHATRWAAAGRCQPSSWISTSRSDSSWNTPPPTARRQRPVMIHRALFGSIERFFGILTEHYAGAFPAWLAPVQVVGIPVAEGHVAYLEEVARQLKSRGIRVEVDSRRRPDGQEDRQPHQPEGAVHAAGR